jgi:hypothetical protein
MPLWIWKFTAFAGLVIGTASWLKLTHRRFDEDIFIQYKSMLLSFASNLILFLFELIVCEKLESQNSLPWTFCFIPLFLLSLVSVGTLVWSIRFNRSYEIEMFCAINVLQFVFVALRLDMYIMWSWIVSFFFLFINVIE